MKAIETYSLLTRSQVLLVYLPRSRSLASSLIYDVTLTLSLTRIPPVEVTLASLLHYLPSWGYFCSWAVQLGGSDDSLSDASLASVRTQVPAHLPPQRPQTSPPHSWIWSPSQRTASRVVTSTRCTRNRTLEDRLLLETHPELWTEVGWGREQRGKADRQQTEPRHSIPKDLLNV